MEGHCERSESALVSKSSRPVIVSDNEKQEAGKCGHFSIRGYVAEIRRKDRKICWPFPSVGDLNESEEQTDMLPPLHVSESRWWGCQNCLRKTGATTAATDGVVSNCYNTGFKSNNTGSCGNIFMSSHGDAPMVLSGFQQAPEKNSTGETKIDANTSVDVNGDVYCSSLSSEKKKKEVEVVHAIREDICTSGDYGNNAEGNVNQAIPIPTCGATKVNPFLTGERITKDKDAGRFSGTSKAYKHGCNLSAFETAVAPKSVCHYKNASKTVTLRWKGTGLIEFCDPNCESHEVADVGFEIRNLKCTSNNSTGICQKTKPGFSRNDFVKMNEQHREVMKDCGTSEVLGMGNKALNAVTSHTSKLCSLESDKSDYRFSDNEEKLIGNNLHDQNRANHPGNSGGALHQRKTPKVRLLTDIISSEVLGVSSKNRSSGGNANTDHVETEVGPSKATPDGSTGIGLHAVPKSQVVVQRNVRKDILSIKKGRKMPPDENWGPSQMRWPKSVAEKAKIFKGNAETIQIDTAITNSESAEDAPAGINLSTGFNSHLTKHRLDRKPTLGRKENKKARVEDGRSSLMPWQEGMSCEVQVIRRDGEIEHTGIETVVSKSAQNEFMGRGMHPFLESNVSAQRNDRKSISCKKKSKVPQVEDGWASLTPWQEGMSRADQIIPFKSTPDASSGRGVDQGLESKKATHRKTIVSKKRNNMLQVQGGGLPQDVEFKSTGAETVPFKSAQDAFKGRGLHPFLKNFVTAQRNDKESVSCKKKSEIPIVEDGWNSATSWKEGMSREDQIIREDVENKHFGAARVPFKPALDTFSGRGVHRGLNSKKATNRKAFARKKQTSMPRVEGQGSFLMQPKDFSSTCNYEKTIDVQGNLEVIKNQYDQRADKVCEQATLDDIPMEIVELMAKNQYERRLLDVEDATKNKSCLLETTNNMKNAATIDLTEAPGTEMLRLLREKNSNMRKTQSSNAGSGILTTDKSVGSTVGYSSHVNRKYENNDFTICQPEKYHASTGFHTFYQCREKLSSRGQFAVTGSSRNCGTRNRRWNGDMVGHRCSLTCLHSLEANLTCQNISPQSSCKEAHQVWSLMIPNPIPFGINSPQTFGTESSNIEMLPQCPDSPRRGNMDGDHGLKSLNPNAANLQKQNGKLDAETLKRTRTEYRFVCTQKENEYHPKLMGPLDLYTNESISAMHLLRLMDAGMCSSTPVDVDENQKFAKQPSFPNNHQCKEFSGLEIGVSKTSKGSTHPPPDYFGTNHRLGISCEHSPPLTTIDAVASSFQKDGNRRASGFTGQVLAKMKPHSLKSKGKEKTKSSCLPAQTRGPRSHRSVSGSGSPGKNHEHVPFHDLQKGFLSASAVKNSCMTENCTLNRNPADFTLPEAGNKYMIGGEGLRCRKMIPSWDRPGLINMDGHKRQKMMKLTAIQEHVRY